MKVSLWLKILSWIIQISEKDVKIVNAERTLEHLSLSERIVKEVACTIIDEKPKEIKVLSNVKVFELKEIVNQILNFQANQNIKINGKEY